MAFFIGCQSITFGEMHNEDIVGVLDAVAAAGYDGVEMGFFRLDRDKGPRYKEMLDERGLRLTALHVGGNIFEEASQREQMESIDAVIHLARQMGGEFIFISGIRCETRRDFINQAAMYDKLGAATRDSGLILCYHNHDWEIRNGFAGLDILLEKTCPDNMSLVLDVGWVAQAGGDPAAAVTGYASRLRNVHFKEFTAQGGFSELGTGVVDFYGVWEALKTSHKDMWIVAEQDSSVKGAFLSVRENYEYIRKLII